MIGESHLFVAVGAAIFVGAKHLGDDIWNITGIYMSKCFAQPPRIICVNDFCSPDLGNVRSHFGRGVGRSIRVLCFAFISGIFARMLRPYGGFWMRGDPVFEEPIALKFDKIRYLDRLI